MTPSLYASALARLLPAVPLAVGVCAAQGAWAESADSQTARPIEEVLVTAEFRNPRADSAPGSITVLQPADQQTAVQHLEQLLGQVANLNYSKGASRARFIQIRGIGERGQFAEPLNSSVGLIVDGVDMSGIGTAATLFDVAQVEVFRGPQGTLYGANALAGLINVVTAAPTDDFTARVQLDAADYGALGGGVVVAGPASERLGYRFSAHAYRDDGFTDNIHLGADDTDNHDEQALRGKLAWAPNEVSEVTFTFGSVRIDNGYDAFSLDNNRRTRSDQPGRDEQHSVYASAQGTTSLSGSVLLQGSIGWIDSDLDYGYDEDWTFVGFHPFEYSSTDRYQRERDTLSADVRLLSDSAADEFGWVAGVYTLRQNVDLARTYTFLPGPFDSRFEIARLAAYGEVSTPLTQRTRLTAGVRAERHDADYADSDGVAFDPTDHMLGGRVLLEVNLGSALGADQATAYGVVARGYKAGGFNTNGTLDADLREFDPETLWNFEAGLKARWNDGRVSASVALFRMQRDDAQADTSIVRTRSDGSSEFIDYIDNAAEGINQGLELELTWRPTERFTLHASAGLLDAEFDDYINGSGENLSGREQAQAPDYQYFLSLGYAISDSVSATLQREGRGEYFYSNSHHLQSNSYALLNASVAWQVSNWQVRVWGRNLRDEDYFVRGFQFGQDPRTDYTTNGWTQLGEPRQIGITVAATL